MLDKAVLNPSQTTVIFYWDAYTTQYLNLDTPL